MKYNLVAVPQNVTVLVCLLSMLMLIPFSTFSQTKEEKVLSVLKETLEAYITGDSALYFSSYSPDYILIQSNGEEWDREEFWQYIKKRGAGENLVSEITSIKIGKSIAWITHHYTSTNDSSYKEPVTHVKKLENYRWVGTDILEKKGKKWQIILHQYGSLPNE